ncbi:hypothetical protein [Photobacterium damselae]|uniref:hypothetical protein n=1 Tax=Photobacterium damselae TaxID=38293 RepID=UPI004067EF6D
MISIQVSSIQSESNLSGNTAKVYWTISLPESIAQRQLRPKEMMGVINLTDIVTGRNAEEKLAIAELKALNILFCYESGLNILNTKDLDTSRFHILCTSYLATNALRGGRSEQNSYSKELLHASIPAATMFFGAKFNQLSHFEPSEEHSLKNDEYSITDIPDSLLVQTEIGYLSMTRKALDCFTRRKVRKNPYQELAQILSTSHLTIKFQSTTEREQRIERSGYDCEIVCVDDSSQDSGLRIIIPKKASMTTSGVESYSIVALFYHKFGNENGNVLNRNHSDMATTHQLQQNNSNFNNYENQVMYLEINRTEKLVTAQFGEDLISIDMFNSPNLELNYIDASFIALNLMHLKLQPQKRIRVFTNENIIVDVFNDISAIDHLVNSDSKIEEKLRERILFLMYKTRFFANVRKSAKQLRPLPCASIVEDYSKVNFDVFGKLRQRDRMMFVKPHAFARFLDRALPEQLEANGSKNPLMYLFRIIKCNQWSVVVEKDSAGLQHWYNFDTNSLLVVEENASNNTFNVVTFWHGNKYDNPKYKDEHPEKFARVEKELAKDVTIKKVDIIK